MKNKDIFSKLQEVRRLSALHGNEGYLGPEDFNRIAGKFPSKAKPTSLKGNFKWGDNGHVYFEPDIENGKWEVSQLPDGN